MIILKDNFLLRRNALILIAFFVIGDICYSFVQHFHTHFDGDMASFILRTKEWQSVLTDPFGFKVLLYNQTYPDPNRFFSHWFISFYFRSVPFFFQLFLSPLDSVYLSCALIKTAVQVGLLFFLGAFITGSSRIKKETILAIAIVTPFFQAIGFSGHMGIVDQSISYLFFYALPFSLLMLFYFIIYFSNDVSNTIGIIKKIVLISLSLILPFTGPLIAGIIFIANPLIYIFYTRLNKKTTDFQKKINSSISKKSGRTFNIFYFALAFQFVVSIYSLYIGMHNSINIQNPVPLIERYFGLPQGIYNIFTQKLGLPLLLIIIIVNTLIIRYKFHEDSGKKIFKLATLIILFSLTYIFLLPMGGYRFYRPNTIRFDTFMPVTFLMVFYFGISAYFILDKMKDVLRKLYVLFFCVIAFIYSNADKPIFDDYLCERTAIEEIAQSSEKIVKLSNDCTILSWNKITDPKKSERNGQLIYYWNISNEKKYYFQQ